MGKSVRLRRMQAIGRTLRVVVQLGVVASVVLMCLAVYQAATLHPANSVTGGQFFDLMTTAVVWGAFAAVLVVVDYWLGRPFRD
ncbi:Kef-type K+ transport system membrane component KefB [Azospirillum sp. OGB3]|uniref:hypothetical protein n=1 Tax=Azospirillum sp. OGB3 TaxID=2587012 RepID=UPI001606B768|nr:hypothetical protein [Azospirillum sp. OGB3]MBB3267707.1 Kef-type K+ transport system membrane component KefB [Azospirillum sp. OGB3]